MLAESLVALVGLVSLRALPDASLQAPAFNELPVAKYAAPAVAVPVKRNFDSLGVETTARAVAVLDVKSGTFILEKDASTAYPIASLTKLMTAMTYLDTKPNLDEELVLQADDDPKDDGKAVFALTEKLTKRDLLKALLVGSVNTAGNALARSTGDREAFVRTMNVKAAALGLRNAVFVDPTGLDARNHASAKDVALMMRAALNYPEIREYAKLDRIEVKSRITNRSYTIKTTNLLLDSFLNKKPYQIVVGKTGSLPEAGFCMAQTTKNADGNEIISVVLGSDNHFARFQDTKALTYWTFQNYEWPRTAFASDHN